MAADDTQLTIVGNLVDDPQLRYTATATRWQFPRASHPVLDKATNEWRDGDACPDLQLGPPAENVAESLQRGMRVIVSGRLRQRSETREGRSGPCTRSGRRGRAVTAERLGHGHPGGPAQGRAGLAAGTRGPSATAPTAPTRRSDWRAGTRARGQGRAAAGGAVGRGGRGGGRGGGQRLGGQADGGLELGSRPAAQSSGVIRTSTSGSTPWFSTPQPTALHPERVARHRDAGCRRPARATPSMPMTPPQVRVPTTGPSAERADGLGHDVAVRAGELVGQRDDRPARRVHRDRRSGCRFLGISQAITRRASFSIDELRGVPAAVVAGVQDERLAGHLGAQVAVEVGPALARPCRARAGSRSGRR